MNEKVLDLNPKNVIFLMPIKGETATKTFAYQDNQWILEDNYQAGKYFKGFCYEMDGLKTFYHILKQNQEHPAFMIHGGILPGTDMNKMIRRKRLSPKDGLKPTICDRKIHLVCIDIDGHILPTDETIDDFIEQHLPNTFHTADYIYQYSASYKLTTQNLNCHLFFWLDEPLLNTDIKRWMKQYNKFKDWGNILDDSIYTCTQPIYTQRRICKGAPDPIEDFIGLVKKDGPLYWDLMENVVTYVPNDPMFIGVDPGKGSDIVHTSLWIDKQPYDLSTSIEKILTSENYHTELRSMALSLANQSIPQYTVKQLLEGSMNAAKRSLYGDNKRLEDWQNRFDDISRAVDSAFEIVDHPTVEDIEAWIDNTPISTVRAEFAKKVLNLNPIELKGITGVIARRLDIGLHGINSTIKLAREEKEQDIQDKIRKIKTNERLARGIHEIELTNDNHKIVTESISHLIATSQEKPQVFMIGKSLSIVTTGQPKTVRQIISKDELGGDYPEMPITQDISKPIGVLRNRVEQSCVFLNEKGRSVICPDSILASIPKMYGIKWRPLSGIVEHPFINDKWEVVKKHGYDKRTGLYSVIHKKLKTVKMKPDIAYRYLSEECFAEFPFASSLDKTAAVAALMTAIQRPYITGDGGFPGFAMVSPTQSSGKTTLAQFINYAIYNRPAAATSWSDNDEELGKHLLAILRESHSCVLFDNIRQGATIKSDELAKAMTSGTYSRRKLGENETEEVPASVLWLFTGNNIRFVGDFATRIIPIRIVPDIERPETRTFQRDNIGEWALDHRKDIVSAVLSLVMHGKDILQKKFSESSRFKSWDIFVRKPLQDISGNNILEIFQRNDYDDDETLAKSELLQLIYDEFADKPFKTRELLLKCNGDTETGSFNSDGSDLRLSVMEAFNDKAIMSSKTLGRFLLGMKDAVIGDYKLIKNKNNKGNAWIVKQIYHSQGGQND